MNDKKIAVLVGSREHLGTLIHAAIAERLRHRPLEVLEVPLVQERVLPPIMPPEPATLLPVTSSRPVSLTASDYHTDLKVPSKKRPPETKNQRKRRRRKARGITRHPSATPPLPKCDCERYSTPFSFRRWRDDNGIVHATYAYRFVPRSAWVNLPHGFWRYAVCGMAVTKNGVRMWANRTRKLKIDNCPEQVSCFGCLGSNE